MLTIEIIDKFDEFIRLETVWNRLVGDSDIDRPFLTFEWIRCWWKSYGSGSELMILIVKDGSEIIGIAPLMKTVIKYRGFSMKAVTFIANYHTNETGIILLKRKEHVTNAILEYLFNLKDKMDMFHLGSLADGSDTDINFKKILNENNIKYIRRQSNISPYIKLDSNWQEYLSARSKKLKRKLKNLDKTFGNYEICGYSNNRINNAIEQVLEISGNSWKADKGTAIAGNDENINFYTSLANTVSAKGWLKILVLEFNKKPAAFMFNLEYKGRTYSLKTGYDKEIQNLSPGIYILKASVKDAFENGRKEYDLLGVNEPYKMRWASSCTSHHKYLIFSGTIKGRIMKFLESNIRPLIKKVIKNKSVI